VFMPLNHLRRKGTEYFPENCETGRGRVHGPSEVSTFQFPTRPNQYSLSSDIAMDHLFQVAMRNGAADLDNFLRRSVPAEVTLLTKQFEYLAVRRYSRIIYTRVWSSKFP
jgi:hypothetical protein